MIDGDEPVVFEAHYLKLMIKYSAPYIEIYKQGGIETMWVAWTGGFNYPAVADFDLRVEQAIAAPENVADYLLTHPDSPLSDKDKLYFRVKVQA